MTTAELVTCDGCETGIPEDLYDANDGLCSACLALHFECEECGERTHQDEAHKSVKGLCESCGDDRVETERQEALDAAAEELRSAVESIIDSEDLDAVRKALEALKAAK